MGKVVPLTTHDAECEGKVYVYEIAPIDWWSGWIHEDDYRHQLIHEHRGEDDPGPYLSFRREAFTVARANGWEGDIRPGCGPFVSALPLSESYGLCPVMLAWKQDNNGVTFVASPFPLPWLGRPIAQGDVTEGHHDDRRS